MSRDASWVTTERPSGRGASGVSSIQSNSCREGGKYQDVHMETGDRTASQFAEDSAVVRVGR